MSYILLILFPSVVGASCFILRKQTQLAIIAAIVTMVTQVALLLQLPVDEPARLLGLTLVLDPLSRLFLGTFYFIMAIAFAASWRIPHGENFVPIALLLLSFTGATLLLLQEPFVVALLLISAAVLAVLAIVDLPTGSPMLVGRTSIATGLKYLVLMVISGVLLYLAFVLISIYTTTDTARSIATANLILGLLTVGFGIRMATIPFPSWLPDLAEDAAPMVSVMVMTIINITSLLFLLNTFQFFGPIILSDNERGMSVLRWLGIITALLGALLAVSQGSMRRMLAYLVVYDAGMVLFSLATMTSAGLAGALFEAFNQTVIVTLLFLCVGLLERPDGRPPTGVRRDLLRRWPVAGAGLLGGGLALLGLPPFNGFASKLLIYESAAQSGGPALPLLLLATGVALIALARLAHDRLLGPPEGQPAEETPLILGTTDLDRPAERRLEPEPRGLAILVSALLALCLGVGIYPQPVLSTISDVIRGLTFIRAL